MIMKNFGRPVDSLLDGTKMSREREMLKSFPERYPSTDLTNGSAYQLAVDPERHTDFYTRRSEEIETFWQFGKACETDKLRLKRPRKEPLNAPDNLCALKKISSEEFDENSA
jgi:hypothetical protein